MLFPFIGVLKLYKISLTRQLTCAQTLMLSRKLTSFKPSSGTYFLRRATTYDILSPRLVFAIPN